MAIVVRPGDGTQTDGPGSAIDWISFSTYGVQAAPREMPADETERTMLIVGLILLLLGIFLKVSILYTIGIILLVIGAVLWILGAVGRPVGGRKVWF
ncbi:hypothetical protein [Nucisporomicrobium flavum]|jgi:hypothetical protein|nr:hypothetical protein [Nucisporomicrobium flavum]